jgi:transposase-like protein
VVKDGHKRGQQRWRCRGCDRTFGPTVGTPLYRLHTPAAEVARSLLVVLRRGSLTAAEEITGHKYETIGTWLRRVGDHATALTDALVHDLHLSEVEVDAFWSFVQRSAARLGSSPRPHRPGWAHAGAA